MLANHDYYRDHRIAKTDLFRVLHMCKFGFWEGDITDIIHYFNRDRGPGISIDEIIDRVNRYITIPEKKLVYKVDLD